MGTPSGRKGPEGSGYCSSKGHKTYQYLGMMKKSLESWMVSFQQSWGRRGEKGAGGHQALEAVGLSVEGIRCSERLLAGNPRVVERAGKGVGSQKTAELGQQSEGLMPPEEKSEGGQHSQGPLPEVEDGLEDLQRQLEREVVEKLHEENVKLKQQLELLMQDRSVKAPSTTGWSQVSHGMEMETEEKPQPPSPPRAWQAVERFTLNGTQVPPA